MSSSYKSNEGYAMENKRQKYWKCIQMFVDIDSEKLGDSETREEKILETGATGVGHPEREEAFGIKTPSNFA